MHVGEAKRRCNTAPIATTASTSGVTVAKGNTAIARAKTVVTTQEVPSCSSVPCGKNKYNCRRRTRLPSILNSRSSHFYDCHTDTWSEAVLTGYHKYQQQPPFRQFSNKTDALPSSQSGKENVERSLLTSRSHTGNFLEASTSSSHIACSSRHRAIFYLSHHNLKRASTQQYTTTASSSSSSLSLSSLSPPLSSRYQSSAPHRHYYRRYQLQQRRTLYANLRLFIYWHAFSLLACFAATGLCMRETVSKRPLDLNFLDDIKLPGNDASELLLRQRQQKHFTRYFTTPIGRTTASDNSTTSAHPNPFLRHSRSTAMRLGLTLDSVCYVWSSLTASDLCKLTPWARFQFLKKISIFNRDCSEENNIRAVQLFRLTTRCIIDEADLRAQVHFLRAGVEGQACIVAPAGTQQCLSCFQKVHRGLKEVDKAYAKFNLTLHRFDCMLAVDTASATRPFSPNGSCIDCKIWYRKWLVVHLLDLWSVPPCINWCYYAQLACPHLATIKVVDYAGHPSFQCRDLYIPQVNDAPETLTPAWTTSVTASKPRKKSAKVPSTCSCLHPCDLETFDSFLDSTLTAEQNRPSSYSSSVPVAYYEAEDFFPTQQRCVVRRRICNGLKEEEVEHQHRVVRRSSSGRAGSAVGVNRHEAANSGQRSVALLSYMISAASAAVQWSLDAVAVFRNATIRKASSDSVDHWWTKHRTRRRLKSAADAATPNTTTSTVAPTTMISSAADWGRTGWSIRSGISIYTLFVSMLLLRRPPML